MGTNTLVNHFGILRGKEWEVKSVCLVWSWAHNEGIYEPLVTHLGKGDSLQSAISQNPKIREVESGSESLLFSRDARGSGKIQNCQLIAKRRNSFDTWILKSPHSINGRLSQDRL